jgi:hypothetical protein
MIKYINAIPWEAIASVEIIYDFPKKLLNSNFSSASTLDSLRFILFWKFVSDQDPHT